ncbi:MAG: hypothetical protein HUU35_19740, partial [Armatimonadetes bacterium]|nr:hypothetical protein [Armatimonadota bacterium]
RIAAALPGLLAPERVGRADDLIVPLATRREAWLADPLRNVLLKDSYLPMVEQWLRRQNVDPSSHWSGSMDGWQEVAARPAPANRWDRFRAEAPLYAGASNHYGMAAAHLALAATWDDPTNPYFGRQELLYRAAAASLRDLMVYGENEVFPGLNDLDPYPGNTAFALGQKIFPAFAIAAPKLPPEVRALWAEALRPLFERTMPDELVSARNQSSHYLVAFQCNANGTGDPRDEALARLFARRWARGQHPSGFQSEATGPCASYIGMTHWHEGVFCRLGGDASVLESVRRSYRLFNHTVAPEPDGRMLGGFNFNHRVGDGFYLEQWSGAKGILDDLLPEVGLWAGDAPNAVGLEQQRAEAKQAITEFLANPKPPLYADINTARYLYRSDPDRSQVWPAQEQASYIRRFADQMIAVKRPGYYTSVWVGKPAPDVFYIRGREALRLPFANGIEDNGGDLPEVRKVTPFLGGGLTGFWTPAYGHALMAACWSPTTHHGLTATQTDGKRYWEDYFAHTHQLDEATGTLTIDGKVEGQPVRYQRVYRFGEEALEVELTVT